MGDSGEISPDLIEFSWYQRVENTAREGVQNMHHWTGPINDATDEWRDKDMIELGRSQSLFQSVQVTDAYFYTFPCNSPRTL